MILSATRTRWLWRAMALAYVCAGVPLVLAAQVAGFSRLVRAEQERTVLAAQHSARVLAFRADSARNTGGGPRVDSLRAWAAVSRTRAAAVELGQAAAIGEIEAAMQAMGDSIGTSILGTEAFRLLSAEPHRARLGPGVQASIRRATTSAVDSAQRAYYTGFAAASRGDFDIALVRLATADTMFRELSPVSDRFTALRAATLVELAHAEMRYAGDLRRAELLLEQAATLSHDIVIQSAVAVGKADIAAERRQGELAALYADSAIQLMSTDSALAVIGIDPQYGTNGALPPTIFLGALPRLADYLAASDQGVAIGLHQANIALSYYDYPPLEAVFRLARSARGSPRTFYGSRPKLTVDAYGPYADRHSAPAWSATIILFIPGRDSMLIGKASGAGWRQRPRWQASYSDYLCTTFPADVPRAEESACDTYPDSILQNVRLRDSLSRRALADLAAELLEGAEKELISLAATGTSLDVEVARPAMLVPFAVLPIGPDHTPLGELFALRFIYASRSVGALSGAAARGGHGALGPIGDLAPTHPLATLGTRVVLYSGIDTVKVHDSLMLNDDFDLTGVLQSTTALAHALRVKVLRGDSLSRVALDSLVRDASVIHIFAHGGFYTGFYPEGYLALTIQPDADISSGLVASQVQRMPLRGAPLVTLAACESAITPRSQRADGSVAGAFIQAGASAVIGTMWKVSPPIAAAFYEAFYMKLRSAATVEVSFRFAQAHVRKSYKTPIWAMFVLIVQD